ncbi:glycoside hydrolase family 5 protein [Nocardioides sp. zg-DK7169]|uniref:glycoside hydrolase family 5 protein n=1 Tax=Nocardioides sp. zg-DK7169 TaxID=2736600 RepID=UPI00155378DC|nr:cellulase family glycosylhydrolase [Nocardioides sp. zg-DK7169]NPC98472.1 cellulase family glycosylhydrolase [Nocardioides sp. zg-DK7169]
MTVARRRRRLAPVVVAAVLAALVTTIVTGVLRGGADPAPADTGAAQPQVVGARLVDARDGAEFLPRGVNWSSFEYACAQGWGLSSLDGTVGADKLGAQARAMAAWGMNTVRIPLNQDCWLGTRGAPVSDAHTERTAEDYRLEVAAFVRALNTEGLVVVLDLHSRKRATSPEFGNLAMPDAQSLDFWRSLAQTFRTNPSVMFDAFNEPYSRYDAADRLIFELTWECWRDGGCAAPVEDDRMASDGRTTYAVEGMAAVVSTIRDTGARQPVLLGGLDYANDLSRWAEFAPDDDQLVAAFHSYDFKECGDVACWEAVLAPLADRVPVLTAELGARDPLDGYVEDYLDWADGHGIGSLFWVWADHPDDPMSLISNLDGAPTAFGDLVRAHLAGAGD